MTPRHRLSLALRNAQSAARRNQLAQNELHDAFEAVYGQELDVEALGGESWVDALVYGHGSAPSIAELDAKVKGGE